MFLRYIAYLSIALIFCAQFFSNVQSAATFDTDYRAFAASKLHDLRLHRANRYRTCDIALASDVIDFIAQSATRYGAQNLAAHSETPNLLVDLCDVINLQNDDFKATYTDDITALGFDFYAFDRLAKIINQRSTLFGGLASHYGLVERVISHNLPLFGDVFTNIRDLQAGRAKSKSLAGKKFNQLNFCTMLPVIGYYSNS